MPRKLVCARALLPFSKITLPNTNTKKEADQRDDIQVAVIMANEPPAKPLYSSVPPPSPAPVAPRPPAPQAVASGSPAQTSTFLAALFRGTNKPGEITVYHHSTLFYWWPVWLFGFIMAAVTYFSDKHMAVVPAGTVPAHASEGKAPIDGQNIDLKDRDILILADKKNHLTHKDSAGQERIVQPTIFIASQKSVGTIFMLVLLLVIAITNVHMRGLWSFFVLLVIVMLAAVFAAAGWWESIFAGLGQLSIHINMGGYILLSSVLFILWLINFVFFDRQIYMIFSPGQVRVRLEIGGGETVYDTSGMVVQKYRSDLFRHWILGFGSGDLVVRPNGAAQPIEMPNVLAVGRKVRLIENLIKEKVVLAQQ